MGDGNDIPLKWYHIIPHELQKEFINDESKYCRKEFEEYYSVMSGNSLLSTATAQTSAAVLRKREEFLRLWCKVKCLPTREE